MGSILVKWTGVMQVSVVIFSRLDYGLFLIYPTGKFRDLSRLPSA